MASKAGVTFKDEGLICKLLGIEPSCGAPTGLVCSFCGVHVEKFNATFGVGKPRKIVSTQYTRDINGNLVDYEDKVIHVAEKVVACPKCCLQVGPVYNRCVTCKGKDKVTISNCPHCRGTKRGELSSQGTKFPDFD